MHFKSSFFDAELAHSDWLQHKLTFRCRASSLFDAVQDHYLMQRKLIISCTSTGKEGKAYILTILS